MSLTRTLIAASAALALTGTLARPASAQTATFNFDADAAGTFTSLTDTDNGVAATFSSPLDPFIFQVQQTFFSNMSGNILGPGQVGANFVPLDITFSKPMITLALNFGLVGTATSKFTLTAYSGGLTGTVVGTKTATGALPGGGVFLFPEGSLTFTSASPFDTVELTSTAQNLAVDNLARGCPRAGSLHARQPGPAAGPGRRRPGLEGAQAMRPRLSAV